jgi:aspartate-semialdehyde dehydrogenase
MGAPKPIHLALLGTDSLRGRELRKVMEKGNLPPHEMEFFDPSVQTEYSNLSQYRGEAKIVRPPDPLSVSAADLVFLAADGDVNLEYGRMAEEKGFIALDLSLTFNREPRIPVVVAGINEHVLRERKAAVFANPHPASILLAHIFFELKSFRIEKAVAFLMQPVSAFGQEGIDELAAQTIQVLDGAGLSRNVFKSQIAFNCLSQTESVDRNGFSPSEKQIVEELRRIFQDGKFPLTLSIVQVPVFFSYAVMIYLELGNKASIQSLRNAFKDSSCIKALSPSLDCLPSAVFTAGSEKIVVGQIKNDRTVEKGYWLWGATDNFTRGSALNAVEITRVLLENLSR